jgi:hypothetical protein
MDITSNPAIASASIDQLLDVVLYARQWLTVVIAVELITLAENQVARVARGDRLAARTVWLGTRCADGVERPADAESLAVLNLGTCVTCLAHWSIGWRTARGQYK